MTSVVSINSAAEALAARYRNEPFFIGTSHDGERVRLIVRCAPFEVHRPVMGWPVVVVARAA